MSLTALVLNTRTICFILQMECRTFVPIVILYLLFIKILFNKIFYILPTLRVHFYIKFTYLILNYLSIL